MTKSVGRQSDVVEVADMPARTMAVISAGRKNGGGAAEVSGKQGRGRGNAKDLLFLEVE